MSDEFSDSLQTPKTVEPRESRHHVCEVIRSAEKELRELLAERAAVMKRIGTIRQTIAGLSRVFGDIQLDGDLLHLLGQRPSTRKSGFTRACRAVLIDAKKPLTAREVCEEVRQRFPENLARHKDGLASVTTVLTRLVDYAEAECMVNREGKRVWLWAAEPEISGLANERP